MGHLDVLLRPTQFAGLGQQPLDNLRATIPVAVGSVIEDGIHASLQWHASPLGKQGVLSFPLNDHLKSFVAFAVGEKCCMISFLDFAY